MCFQFKIRSKQHWFIIMQVCYILTTTERQIQKGCMKQTECEAMLAHHDNCRSWRNDEPFCYECCNDTSLCNERPDGVPVLRAATTTVAVTTPVAYTGTGTEPGITAESVYPLDARRCCDVESTPMTLI